MLKEKIDNHTLINRVLYISASGLVVSEMDLELRNGQMVPNMLATGKIIEHMDKENSFISMVICTKENG
jgi:hypothetical protein